MCVYDNDTDDNDDCDSDDDDDDDDVDEDANDEDDGEDDDDDDSDEVLAPASLWQSLHEHPSAVRASQPGSLCFKHDQD